MRTRYGSIIRNLLLKEETEDLERDLNLALYHLNNSGDPETEFKVLSDGLKQHILVPYIIGYTLVCGTRIIVNRNVINPGPETVTLVEKAVEFINSTKVTNVLDLCTGSGVFAVVIAKRCGVSVTAVDISAEVLEVAKLNASNNGVNIEFFQGDLFLPVKGRNFNIIVTNPPYVKTTDIAHLPHFIRDFAPIIAIDGGDDGLFFHKAILSQADKFLCGSKSIFIECEDGQDKEVINLCHKYNWHIENKYQNRHGRIRGLQIAYKKQQQQELSFQN